MTDMREELRHALEADESCDLDAIIRQRRPEDFEASADSSEGVRPPGRRIGPGPSMPWAGGGIRPSPGQSWISCRASTMTSASWRSTLSAAWAPAKPFDGILQFVNDESLSVRKFVTRALARINTPQARTGLSELERTDPSDYIRSLAAGQLSRG